MGKSFYTGTDLELYSGSEVFATKIAATPLLYGLTAPEAASYGTLNTTWRAAWEAVQDPSTRTTPKVAAKNSAREAVRSMAALLADRVYGTASVTDEMKLDLGLSVRKDPAPVGPPGTPENLRVALAGNGAIDLGWKCSNPVGSTGTMYMVWRRIGTGEFQFLGGTGEKKYTDETLPAGSMSVTYQLQAVRSTAVGGWVQFNVNFGIGSGGAMTATVSEALPAKVAA